MTELRVGTEVWAKKIQAAYKRGMVMSSITSGAGGSVGTSASYVGVAMKNTLKEEIMTEVAEVIADMKIEYEERVGKLEEQVVKQQDMIDNYLVPVSTGGISSAPIMPAGVWGHTTITPSPYATVAAESRAKSIENDMIKLGAEL